MNLYRIPPAGSRIAWSEVVDEGAVRGLFAPWATAFFASGTAALAALLVALKARDGRRNEVILSAYNCPAMISAARFAGCEPRLVDLVVGRPWMDQEAVQRVLSSRTLAILGVDLFGIPERYGSLRELAVANGCALVQDSAQGFPKRAGEATWQGDAVVVSFGRGKPVSLLGGGAVLCRDRDLARETAELAEGTPPSEVNHRRLVTAYNLMRHPRLYWWPASLPALRLGETRFEPLTQILGMPSWLKQRVPPAVAAYRARGSGAEAQYAGLSLRGGLYDVARSCGLPAGAALSRYPLLAASSALRDHVCDALDIYGASRFYNAVLPQVAGLEDLPAAALDYPNARDFAARLFTLPTHDGVQLRHVFAMARHLREPCPQNIRPIGESAG